MSYKLSVVDQENQTISITIDRMPDRCPVCLKHGEPKYLTATLLSHGFQPLFAVFTCPVAICRRVYVAEYRVGTSPAYNTMATLSSTGLFRVTDDPQFPSSVRSLSPDFCLTFTQANIAEQNKLDQICGSGYRRALEFLVKDFLVKYVLKDSSDMHEGVRKAFLGACIKDFVDDVRIKECAKRAAWLGNDAVHYEQRWGDKNVSDLKDLISMIMSWIDLLVKSDSILREMPEAFSERGKSAGAAST